MRMGRRYQWNHKSSTRAMSRRCLRERERRQERRCYSPRRCSENQSQLATPPIALNSVAVNFKTPFRNLPPLSPSFNWFLALHSFFYVTRLIDCNCNWLTANANRLGCCDLVKTCMYKRVRGLCMQAGAKVVGGHVTDGCGGKSLLGGDEYMAVGSIHQFLNSRLAAPPCPAQLQYPYNVPAVR